MPDSDRTNVPIKSVETSLRIVQALQERGSAGVSELATHLEASKSTVYNHLKTLERNQYVVRQGNEYRLGLRYLDHGGHVQTRESGFRIIEPKVREIAEETGEICQFIVEENGNAVVVFLERGPDAVETRIRVGTYGPIHELIGGKALLAGFTPEKRDEYFDSVELTSLTSETVTDKDELRKDLREAEERGYAINREEQINGLGAISVPITSENELVGALCVVGPTYRLEKTNYQESVTDTLLGTANELELNVTYSRF